MPLSFCKVAEYDSKTDMFSEFKYAIQPDMTSLAETMWQKEELAAVALQRNQKPLKNNLGSEGSSDTDVNFVGTQSQVMENPIVIKSEHVDGWNTISLGKLKQINVAAEDAHAVGSIYGSNCTYTAKRKGNGDN